MHYEFVVERVSDRKELSLRMTTPVDFLYGTLKSHGPNAKIRMFGYENGKLAYLVTLSESDVKTISEHKIKPGSLIGR